MLSYSKKVNVYIEFSDHKKNKVKESEAAQLCPTLCNPTDYSLPGSSVHRIFQARVLEWVAISFSRGDLSDPGNEPGSPTLRANTLHLSHQGIP